MPCEHYKEAIIEAAVGGAAPLGELRAHLAECVSCRDAFAEEQSLFAAIDSGLHVTANTEVPASLLPRVRFALEQETSLKRSWFSDALVVATAAAIVLAFFTVRTIRHPADGREPMNTAVKTLTSSPKPTSPQEPMRSSEPKLNSASSPRPLIARSSTGLLRDVAAASMPEVLVPRDQEALLVSYAEQWHRQKHAPLVASEVADSSLEPLQVPPIQIRQLDVKPLAAENSQ